MEAHPADATAKGATVRTGGRRSPLGPATFEPSVLTGITQDMIVTREETFAPLAPIITFRDEADAIEMANAFEFGLAACFYGHDMRRVFQVAEALQSGMVSVNTAALANEMASFGGVKQSASGTRHGIEGYSEPKDVALGGVQHQGDPGSRSTGGRRRTSPRPPPRVIASPRGYAKQRARAAGGPGGMRRAAGKRMRQEIVAGEAKGEASASRKRVSGGSAIYETLRREIIELVLAPGSPLDEVGLSERFGLSRTPVREALVRLSSDGLVTTLPNRATIVSAIDFLNLPHFFDALTLMYRVTTRLAAAHRSDADLAAIRRLQGAFTQAVATRDALAMIDTNREFHAAIARAGRNGYYTTLFLKLLDEGRRILRLYYSSFNDELPNRYVDEHERMIEAVTARDEVRADELAAQHADQIVRQIQSYIAADQRRTHTMALERLPGAGSG